MPPPTLRIDINYEGFKCIPSRVILQNAKNDTLITLIAVLRTNKGPLVEIVKIKKDEQQLLWNSDAFSDKEIKILDFYLQSFIQINENGSYYDNIGIQRLTRGLKKNITFSNHHTDLVVTTLLTGAQMRENTKNLSNSIMNNEQVQLEDIEYDLLQAESQQYQRNLSSIIDKLEPALLGCYDKKFAQSVHLFYAPSELLHPGTGEQVRLSPLHHFSEHRVYPKNVLLKLAKMAFDLTYSYENDKTIYRPLDFKDSVKSLQLSSDVRKCYLTNVFTRYLALMANMIKYEYDYNFRLGTRKKTSAISDLFGDSLLSLTGDCEDAGRIVADVWRSTVRLSDADLRSGKENAFLALQIMRNMVSFYNLYTVLCTIQTSNDMAHCTCILVPENSNFSFAIVEGTNFISPFAATGVPLAIEQFITSSKIASFCNVQKQLMANPEDENATEIAFQTLLRDVSEGEEEEEEEEEEEDEGEQNSKDNSFILAEQPNCKKRRQAPVSNYGLEGRASAKGWYGLFHNAFKIGKLPGLEGEFPLPEACVLVKKGTGLYGVAAEDFMTGNVEFRMVPQLGQNTKTTEIYKRFVSWRQKEGSAYGVFGFDLGEEEEEEQEEQRNEANFANPYPVLKVTHVDSSAETSSSQYLDSPYSPYRSYTFGYKSGDGVHINADIHYLNPINVTVSGQAKTAKMADVYDKVMAPFGAAAARKMYPCSDASMVSAIAARYQQVTGAKLKLLPHVDIHTLVRGKAMPPLIKAPSAIRAASRKPPLIKAPSATRAASRKPRTVSRHPLAGKSGDLITALQNLNVSTKGKDKNADVRALHDALKNTSDKHFEKIIQYAKTHTDDFAKFVKGRIGDLESATKEKFDRIHGLIMKELEALANVGRTDSVYSKNSNSIYY